MEAKTPNRLFIWLPERSLLKMPQTDGEKTWSLQTDCPSDCREATPEDAAKDGGETSSKREFSHRPRPSSPDNRVLFFVLYKHYSQSVHYNTKPENTGIASERCGNLKKVHGLLVRLTKSRFLHSTQRFQQVFIHLECHRTVTTKLHNN